ncbi:MAG: MotA/TolQ/ExbB proton channel family protein [Planctomycetota bacterium]
MKSLLFLAAVLAAPASAQEPRHFLDARTSVRSELDQSLVELATLRERIAKEQLPMNEALRELQNEVLQLRAEHEDASRSLTSATLQLAKQQQDNKQRQEEVSYLTSQLMQYAETFESRLHIAELHRYEDLLDTAKMAPENANLTPLGVIQAHNEVVTASLTRLEDAADGEKYRGSAVSEAGVVWDGTFLQVGPGVLFTDDKNLETGWVEERLGSLEPALIAFTDPKLKGEAEGVIASGGGTVPFDTTLGNAHKVQATQVTLWDEVEKGGTVMIPIFIMASLALLVCLYKWLRLSLVRKPSQRKVRALLDAVEQGKRDDAIATARSIGGPSGAMLLAGIDHMDQPAELVEEVMYERVMTERMKLQSLLPFVAICAASAPLLGLLGTVTGIIRTFELITVFGSGDVKTLSGGISEALITTKYGLIVAIPSLLLHAFLSRKARSIASSMETTAVAFSNQLAMTRNARPQRVTTAEGETLSEYSIPREAVRAEIREILGELLGPMAGGSARNDGTPSSTKA